jgi:hypothetical protein
VADAIPLVVAVVRSRVLKRQLIAEGLENDQCTMISLAPYLCWR